MTQASNVPRLSGDELIVHADHLRRLVRRLVLDDHAADDVVQRTFATALESPPRHQANLRGWLARVAVNFARQERRSGTRRVNRERASGASMPVPSAADVAQRMDLLRRITVGLEQLEEPYRSVLYLRYFEELSAAEIGRRLGVPAATIRTQCRRGLERMRKDLDGDAGAWRAALLPLCGVDTATAAERPPSASRAVGTGIVATVLVTSLLIGVLPQRESSPADRRRTLRTVPAPTTRTIPLEERRERRRDQAPPAVELPVPGAPNDTGPVTPPRVVVRLDPPPDRSTPPSETPQARKPLPDAHAPAEPIETVSTAAGWVAFTHLPGTDAMPLGMVALPEVAAQPIGIDPGEQMRVLARDIDSPLLRRDNADALRRRVLLFSTPAHLQSVPALWIDRHEVTNAQWQVFLESAENRVEGVRTTARLDTLAALASDLYGVDGGSDLQRAWLALLDLNPELRGHLPGADGNDWDPLLSGAASAKLPVGVAIVVWTHLPPPHWGGREPPAAIQAHPVREISWDAAADFCRWAGVHLPTESEWERAARGKSGRLFPWGDDWEPRRAVWNGFDRAVREARRGGDESVPDPIGPGDAPGGPAPVNDPRFEDGATPEGVRHMAGNVSEWVFDFARRYPGSDAEVKLEGVAHVARGGNYLDDGAFLLATDRAAEGAAASGSASQGIGLRIAAYPHAGRDLAMPLHTAFSRPNAISGPPQWLPTPPGLARKDREDRSRRARFQGFDLAATAGFVRRDVTASPGAGLVRFKGPARGLALMPVRGLPPGVRTGRDLDRLVSASDQTVLLGVLTGTDGLGLEVAGEGGRPRILDLSDPAFHAGAFLVLRGVEVLVYPADPGSRGSADLHLTGEPFGRLALPFERSVVSNRVSPACDLSENEVALTVGIPVLDAKGRVPRIGRHVRVTVRFALGSR